MAMELPHGTTQVRHCVLYEPIWIRSIQYTRCMMMTVSNVNPACRMASIRLGRRGRNVAAECILKLLASTYQVSLALAFFCEALILGLHEKHEPLDAFVHKALFYSSLSAAAFSAAEAAWTSTPLFTAGRLASTFLHGAWFMVAAQTLYGGK